MFDNKFNNKFSIKILFLIFKNRNVVYFNLLMIDKINSRMYSLNSLLHDKFELIHLFSYKCNALDFSISIINANENVSAFGIQKGDYCLEYNIFKIWLFHRNGIILEFDSHILQRKFFTCDKVPFTTETLVLMRMIFFLLHFFL